MKIAAVDIGGTSIKSGLWDQRELTQIRETDTNASLGGPHVMQTVLKILEEYGEFDAVGISTAGQVDPDEGRIIYANENIPGYTGTKIRQMITDRFSVPAAVLNDVNSAAVGEAFFGAGQGYDSFLCLTYGTGVGGAILLNGRVYGGCAYSAGEFGGIVIHPENRFPKQDFLSGCYERYASTTALVKLVRKSFPDLKNGRDIFAQLENPSVRSLIDQWIMEIVYGLVTLVHIFQPALIVLGGGVMEQSYVMESVRTKLLENVMPPFRRVAVRGARLGNRAGMLGAVREAGLLIGCEIKPEIAL